MRMRERSGSSWWRSFCQGAAARNVSIRLRRKPGPGAARRTPAGRPWALPACSPPPGRKRAGAGTRLRSEAAPTDGRGCAARTASRMTSSSGWFSLRALSSVGLSAGGSGSGCSTGGIAVARELKTRRAASAASASITSARPASAAAAWAARKASSGARIEAMPSACAVPHRASNTSSPAITQGSRSRAARCFSRKLLSRSRPRRRCRRDRRGRRSGRARLPASLHHHPRPRPAPPYRRGGQAAGETVALQPDNALIENTGQPPRHPQRQPLRHGEHHNPAIRFGQDTALDNRTAGLKGRWQIQTAKQTAILHMTGHSPHAGFRRKHPAQQGYPTVAHRPRRRPQGNADQPHRIDREERCGQNGVFPGCGGFSHNPAQTPNSSVTARSIRADDPASSSGFA